MNDGIRLTTSSPSSVFLSKSPSRKVHRHLTFGLTSAEWSPVSRSLKCGKWLRLWGFLVLGVVVVKIIGYLLTYKKSPKGFENRGLENVTRLSILFFQNSSTLKINSCSTKVYEQILIDHILINSKHTTTHEETADDIWRKVTKIHVYMIIK